MGICPQRSIWRHSSGGCGNFFTCAGFPRFKSRLLSFYPGRRSTCQSFLWCTYCGCVRITAVECGQSYPSINIIQQVTSINTKWDGARGSDLGMRIGEREEAGSVDFYPYWNGGLVLFYLLIAVAVYHQTFSYIWGYLYFIFEKCTCNWSPAWTGLRCTGPPVITVALANDEGRSNGTNVRRIQLDGISYLL